MNNLGYRATELLDARQKVYLGDWGCISDPGESFDEACTVIEGYQDLVRRIVNILDKGMFHKATTVSELEFVIEGEPSVNQFLMALVEAKASIP